MVSRCSSRQAFLPTAMTSLFELDRRLYVVIHRRLRLRRLDAAMVWLSAAGTKGAIWVIAAVILAALPGDHHRLAAIASVVALLVAEGVINLLLKPGVRRRRPYLSLGGRHLLVAAPGPHSWPSAHAGSSAAAAVTLAYVVPWVGLPALILAGLIGYSRIYVGVHYPVDVVAGVLIGIASSALVLSITARVVPL